MEKATRDILIFQRIVHDTPEPSPKIRQEMSDALERAERIVPLLRALEPELRELESALLDLGMELRRIHLASATVADNKSVIPELYRKTRELADAVRLARETLMEPDQAFSSEFYEPRISATLEEIHASLVGLQTKKPNKSREDKRGHHRP